MVVVTEGIRQRLAERGFGDKLALIPNGANTDLFRPDPAAGAALRAELGLAGKFIVLYAGIHGIAQGLETVLEAAAAACRRCRMCILCSSARGPKKAELLAMKERLGLANVTMLPERPRSDMPAFLSAADVALVPLRRLELFEGALPSKMFDAWACGCPVILSIDGEARRVLEQADAGLFVEPEDAGADGPGHRAAEKRSGSAAPLRRQRAPFCRGELFAAAPGCTVGSAAAGSYQRGKEANDECQ